ncbi:MAG: hypothetical protein AAGI66_02145 [Cyanobacteria bacterium P01_H01_bin.74]
MMRFFPLLLIVLFFLDLFAINTSDIISLYLKDFSLCLAIGLVIGLLVIATVYSSFRFLKKDNQVLECLISALLIVFLLYAGEWFYLFHDTVHFFFLKITMKKQMHFLIASFLVLTGLISILAFLDAKKQSLIHQGLVLYLALFGVLKLFTIGSHIVQTNAMGSGQLHPRDSQKSQWAARDEKKPLKNGQLPDIYYIVLDAYPNQEVLKTMYGMDNRAFMDGLRDRGFYIAANSSSNYTSTLVSLGSTLNLDYLDWLAESPNEFYTRRGLLTKHLQNNKVFEIFKSNGYKLVNFASGNELTSGIKADIRVECGSINEFSFLILRKSFAGLFMHTLNIPRRQRFLCFFDKALEIASLKERKFVLIHILSPHRPFLFDESGNPVDDPSNLIGEMFDKVKAGNYVPYKDPWLQKHLTGQILFLNKKVLALVDGLLNQAGPKPIILIQSDHGTGYALQDTPGYVPTDLMLYEKMQILNTFYVPKQIEEQLTQAMTPVNTFRIIINELFGQKLPLLPDHNYYSPYGLGYTENKFNFTDLTKRLNQASQHYIGENEGKSFSR